ncbi:glycogen debranching protein GlgX [uncultured Merdimonas sp.]|uniref:glycogen debranching protein GlgX n=1 Tax=uncultured Merdimonas sp. TaxID=2023269 RepID=UPI00320A0105
MAADAQNVLGEDEIRHMIPLDRISGYEVRPGFYSYEGATPIPGGVNFTVHSHGAVSCELLLYHRKEPKPYAVLPFPENYRIGDVYSMIVFGLNVEEFEYAYRVDGPYDPAKGLLFDKSHVLLDPYAKAVTGQSTWGKKISAEGYRARVVRSNFDWGTQGQPRIPMEDLIIYEMHVRGFTKLAKDVSAPGTFLGIREKIPYLKELGINAIELMPVFEFDELAGRRIVDGKEVLNYWGYNTVSFFAPNTSYASAVEYNQEGLEFKQLVRALHENGMEVILDVVFNHTAEGNEDGPVISFKGFDNNIYYLLTPEGYYYNFSGCGNTMNCNHPVVQRMITDCLRYWVTTYRVDGFRFDLASILGRNEDGSPMEKPPLLQALACDPILADTKLIAEAWDAGGLYQVGAFPAFHRWSEWNGRYRDDLREYLKGGLWCAGAALERIAGSGDLYDPAIRGKHASVNFLTCHDGFTLYDLYSYNQKHNEANGWENTDGANDNRSWNCGWEGDTKDPAVMKLRMRLIRNACAVLFASRGTPMFLAGDEFCNTQFGNNNAYCQDNEISWLDWGRLELFPEIHRFFRQMIRFRKAHPAIRGSVSPAVCGLPEISFHSETPWMAPSEGSKVGAVLFAGYDPKRKKDDIVYVVVNPYWEAVEVWLPRLPDGRKWYMKVNTSAEGKEFRDSPVLIRNDRVLAGARSVMILTDERKER